MTDCKTKLFCLSRSKFGNKGGKRDAMCMHAPFPVTLSVRANSEHKSPPAALTGSLTPHFIPRFTPRLSWNTRSAASPPSLLHRFASKIIPEAASPVVRQPNDPLNVGTRQRTRTAFEEGREGDRGRNRSEGGFHVKSRTILYYTTDCCCTLPPF